MALDFGQAGCGSDTQRRVVTVACHKRRCVGIEGHGEHQAPERLGRSPHMKPSSLPTVERQSPGKNLTRFGREGSVD